MRFIVTGSRYWRASHVIYQVLQDDVEPGDLMLVGDCPTGADFIAKVFWANYTSHDMVRVFPADWQRFGKQAGPARNRAMVGSGAELCLAFLLPCQDVRCKQVRPHGTHGTTNCIRQAQHAGIRTVIWTHDQGPVESGDIGWM